MNLDLFLLMVGGLTLLVAVGVVLLFSALSDQSIVDSVRNLWSIYFGGGDGLLADANSELPAQDEQADEPSSDATRDD